MDSFYPLVSFMAFLSGGCFGWYYAWRTSQRRRVADKVSEPVNLARAA